MGARSPCARAEYGERVSRRDQIVLTPAEQLELLDAERVVVISSLGPRGWPHSMPMWFTLREPVSSPLADGPPREVWVWTYAKSQKVRNLERDPRATLLVETGDEYSELRGVQLETDAEIDPRSRVTSSSSPRS